MTILGDDQLAVIFNALNYGISIRSNTMALRQHIQTQADIIDGFLAFFMATLPESAEAVQNLDSTPSTRALFQYLSIVLPN